VRLPQLKASNNPLFAKNFIKASLFSGAIVIALTVPAVILFPYLVHFFYGDAYAESVRIVYWLAPFAIFSGFAVGVGSLYRTLHKMKEVIIINSFIVAVGIFPVYLIIKMYGTTGIAIATVVWFFLSDFCSFLYIRRFLK